MKWSRIKAAFDRNALFCSAITLGIVFWHSLTRSGLSFALSELSVIAWIAYIGATLIVGRIVGRWPQCLLFILVLVLIAPCVRLAGSIRTHLFLANLPRYQKFTDSLVTSEHLGSLERSGPINIPSEFSDFLIGKHAGFSNRKSEGVAVWYLTGDSSATGHAGYVYLAEDNVSGLKGTRRELRFRKVAPHWYEFAD